MNRSIAILLLAGIVWSGKSADTEYERAVHDAEELLTAGRFEEVIGNLEGWTRDRERYPEAHRLFGLAFYSLQKFPVAILHLQTALRLRPGDSEMHRQMAEVLGVAHYLNGSPRDALPWLEKAAAQGPVDSKLLYTLAMSQMQSGEAAKSAGTIARLYGAAAGSPQALLVTAVHLLQLGMVQDASTLLEKVAITDPTLPDLAYRRGLIALRYANYPVAQKLFEEEIQHSPAHAAAWHALGEARFASANTESAEEALQRAVWLNDRSIESYVFLARIYMDSGRLRLSEDTLKRVLEVDAQNADAYFLYARLCHKTGRPEMARDFLDTVARLKQKPKL